MKSLVSETKSFLSKDKLGIITIVGMFAFFIFTLIGGITINQFISASMLLVLCNIVNELHYINLKIKDNNK